MEFHSPGGAFTSAFNESLLQDAALKRQAMLDDLTRRKTESEISLGQAALAEKRQEHADTLQEKERNQTLSDVAGLAVGDIPDADLVARAKKHHVPLRTTPAEAPAGEMPPESIAAPGITPQNPATVTPEGTGVLATPPPGAIRFAGTPTQALADAKQKKIDGIIKQIGGLDPTSPQFRQLAAQYEMEAGKSLPAAFLSGVKGPKTSSQVIFDPIKKAFFKAGDLNTPLNDADIPEDAKINRSAEPHDTSGRDAAADRQLQNVQEHAYAELNKWAAPVQGHIDAIRELGTMINAKTPEADKLIAPLVIKATIAGQGSGFRMTRAEIENVVGGRSHWESLQAALQQWSLDPTKALSLTESQRDDLRGLTKKIRDKATKLSRQITDARHTIDDATSAGAVNRARTRLQEDLATMDDENAAGGGDSLKVGGTLNGEKILAIRPKAK